MVDAYEEGSVEAQGVEPQGVEAQGVEPGIPDVGSRNDVSNAASDNGLDFDLDLGDDAPETPDETVDEPTESDETLWDTGGGRWSDESNLLRIDLSAKRMQEGLDGLPYAECAVVSAVAGNFVSVGCNWIVLPQVSQGIRNLLSEMPKGSIKLHDMVVGGILEVNPGYLSDRLGFLELDDRSIKDMHSGEYARLRDWFRGDIPDCGYIVLWSTVNRQTVGLQAGVEVPSFCASSEMVRARLKKEGYELSEIGDSSVLGDCSGALFLYYRADKDYGMATEEDESAFLDSLRSTFNDDDADDGLEL